MRLIIHWLVSALAVFLTAYLLPGVTVTGFGVALIVALVLGLINAFVRPILVLITLPLTILTLGIFLIILNTLLIMATAALVPGFVIASFWWALLFSIILSIVSAILHKLIESPAVTV